MHMKQCPMPQNPSIIHNTQTAIRHQPADTGKRCRNRRPTNSTDHQDAVRPPVGGRAVTLPVDHLRCHVLNSAAERVRLLLVEDRLLAQAKIRQLDVTLRVQQDAVEHSDIFQSQALPSCTMHDTMPKQAHQQPVTGNGVRRSCPSSANHRVARQHPGSHQ